MMRRALGAPKSGRKKKDSSQGTKSELNTYYYLNEPATSRGIA